MKKKASQPTSAEPVPPAKPAAKAAKKKTVARKKAASPTKVEATAPPPDPPAPSLTTIAARVDVGFGNTLFIRGNGPGLNWDSGVPMTCQGGNLWSIDITGATQPFAFKFLINDQTWSTGPDYVVDPGAQLEVTPVF